MTPAGKGLGEPCTSGSISNPPGAPAPSTRSADLDRGEDGVEFGSVLWRAGRGVVLGDEEAGAVDVEDSLLDVYAGDCVEAGVGTPARLLHSPEEVNVVLAVADVELADGEPDLLSGVPVDGDV